MHRLPLFEAESWGVSSEGVTSVHWWVAHALKDKQLTP